MWELDHKEGWVPKNWCHWAVVLEKTLESSLVCKEIKQSILKKINPEHSLEGRCWSWSSNTLATWCEELSDWKRPWCWARLKAGGEWDKRGWDGWMASPSQWTWVWVNSGSWWWTGRPGILQFMGSQRIGHDRVTELNWTEEDNKPEPLGSSLSPHPQATNPIEISSYISTQIYKLISASTKCKIVYSGNRKSNVQFQQYLGKTPLISFTYF